MTLSIYDIRHHFTFVSLLFFKIKLNFFYFSKISFLKIRDGRKILLLFEIQSICSFYQIFGQLNIEGLIGEYFKISCQIFKNISQNIEIYIDKFRIMFHFQQFFFSLIQIDYFLTYSWSYFPSFLHKMYSYSNTKIYITFL